MEPFKTKASFDSWIASPLRMQQSKYGMRNLEDLVRATCIRRTKAQLVGKETGLDLPERAEKVEWIDLSPEDRRLYEYFKEKTANIASGIYNEKEGTIVPGKGKGHNIICLINVLRLICGHGERLIPASALEVWQSRQLEAIDWNTMQKWSDTEAICESCGKQLQELGSADEMLESGIIFCKCKGNRESVEERVIEGGGAFPPSNKLQALLRNIREEQRNTGTDQVIKRYGPPSPLLYWSTILTWYL